MTTLPRKEKRSLLWSPVILLWRLATILSNKIGIVATLLTGGVLLLIGFFLTGTLVGAIVGIPMCIAGTFLVIRGII